MALSMSLQFGMSVSSADIHRISEHTLATQSGNSIVFVCADDSEPSETLLMDEGMSLDSFACSYGRQIIACAVHGSRPLVNVYQFPDNKLICSLTEGAEIKYTNVAVSRGGARLISISDLPDRKLILWNIDSGNQVASKEIEDEVEAISFCPADHNRFCTITQQGLFVWQARIKFGEYQLHSTMCKLEADIPRRILSHQWTPDKEILCGSHLGDLLLCSPLQSGSAIEILCKVSEHPLTSLAITKQHLVVGTKGELVWLDIRSNYLRQFKMDLGSSVFATSVMFVVNHSSIVVVDSDGGVHYGMIEGDLSTAVSPDTGDWDAPIKLEQIREWNIGFNKKGRLPRRACFFSHENNAVIWGPGQPLEIWDCETEVRTSRLITNEPVSVACLSPDDRLIVTGNASGILTVIDSRALDNLRIVFSRKLHKNPIVMAGFNPSGTLLVSICSAATIRILRADLRVVAVRKLAATVTCTAWIHTSDGGEVLAVASEEGDVHVLSFPPSLSKLTEDLPPLLESAREKGKSIQISTEFIGLPIHSMASSSSVPNTIFAISADKQLKKYELNITSNRITLQEKDSYAGHQKPCSASSAVAISPNGLMVASCADDGFLILRQLLDPKKLTVTIPCHDWSVGGAASVSFCSSSELLLSAGADGAVLCWNVSDFANSNEVLPDSEEAVKNILSDSSLDGLMSIHEAPTNCALDIMGTLVSEVTLTPTGSPDEQGPAVPEDSLTRRMLEQVTSLRERHQELAEENRNAPELEMLEEDELVVDLELQANLVRRGQKQVDRVRKDIHYGNLGMQLLRDRIKQETWDSMDEKDVSVFAFSTNVAVRNFPLPVVSEKCRELQDQILLSRRMQIMERKYLQDELDTGPGFQPQHITRNIGYFLGVNGCGKGSDEEFYSKASSFKPGAANATSGAHGESGEDSHAAASSLDLENEIDQVVQEQPTFHPMSLWSVQRKVVQREMISLEIEDIKKKFNLQLQDIQNSKRGEIEKIEELNKVAADTLEELGQPFTGVSSKLLELRPEEVPGTVLEVTDEEVKIERVLSDEARAQKEREDTERLEAERMRLADDAPERALDDMMNGTLEAKKGLSLLQQVVEKPAFMDELPPERWNDEHHALADKYNEEVAQVEAERETRRKQLESQLKKAKNDISEIIRSFDDRVSRMYQSRLDTQGQIWLMELVSIQLSNELLDIEQRREREKAFEGEMEALLKTKREQESKVDEFKTKVERAQRQHESLCAEERHLEKTFRKDMARAGHYLDVLWKLFRSRRLGQSRNESRRMGTRMNDITSGDADESTAQDGDETDRAEQAASVRDPFAGIDDQKANKKPPEDLSRLKPEDLDMETWEMFVEKRQSKLTKEQKIKASSSELQEMNAHLDKLQAMSAETQAAIRNLGEKRESAAQKYTAMMLNTRVILKVKQGQVEIEESPVVTDLKNAEMIDRGIVEELNTKIVELGTEKVGVLTDIKDFRKGINMLEWTKKSYNLEYQDYLDQAIEFQLLRVTKDLQELIKVGGHETRQAHEVEHLERKLDFLTKINKAKIAEKKKELSKVDQKMKQQLAENEKLAKTVQALQNAVQQRQEIARISHDGGQQDSRNKKVQAFITRRKLMDLVRAQSEEIEFLRNELERLRKRTFPSFSQVRSVHNRSFRG